MANCVVCGTDLPYYMKKCVACCHQEHRAKAATRFGGEYDGELAAEFDRERYLEHETDGLGEGSFHE